MRYERFRELTEQLDNRYGTRTFANNPTVRDVTAGYFEGVQGDAQLVRAYCDAHQVARPLRLSALRGVNRTDFNDDHGYFSTYLTLQASDEQFLQGMGYSPNARVAMERAFHSALVDHAPEVRNVHVVQTTLHFNHHSESGVLEQLFDWNGQRWTSNEIVPFTSPIHSSEKALARVGCGFQSFVDGYNHFLLMHSSLPIPSSGLATFTG